MITNVIYLYFRMAIERELDKTEISHTANLCFDESGHYLFYPTMLGIKIINTFSNTLVKIIGKPENLRALRVALFQVSTQRKLCFILKIILYKLILFYIYIFISI